MFIDSLALLVAVAGVVVLLASALDATSWRAYAKMALTLWTAAGLLRLAASPSWAAIGASSAIIAVRQLVMWGLKRSGGQLHGPR